MTFIPAKDLEWTDFEWGALGWVTRPASVPEATAFCCLDVRLDPGEGHDFHTHPSQQEIIFVRSGTVEQWVGTECMQLTAGDSCFVPANMVHASFVAAGGPPAQMFVVMSPSHGADGYEAVDVASEEPWRSLRS